MVIGQTYPSVTAREILDRCGETTILARYFGVTSLPCCISSPLREDRRPSFQLYLSSGGHVRFVDYATGERGSLLDLLCRCWRCTIRQALAAVYSMVAAPAAAGNRLAGSAPPVKVSAERSGLKVAVRPWRQYDFDYWASYGVGRRWLLYADIHPVSHEIIVKDGRQYTFSCDKYAYVFVERKDGRVQLKLYQPFNTAGFKWRSKMGRSVIGLWTKIPERGDRVVICSSLKDALCLCANLRIPTLCLQGETCGMSGSAVSELRRRYGKVFISFDTDAPGLKDGERLAAATGFTNIVPDLGTEKDYSDYYKSLSNKEDFKKLKLLFV